MALNNMTQDELYDLATECDDESGNSIHIRECEPCQAWALYNDREEKTKTPALPAEESYEVWVREKEFESSFRTGLIYSVARNWANGFNTGEALEADAEGRQIERVYFAVRATTTYERV